MSFFVSLHICEDETMLECRSLLATVTADTSKLVKHAKWKGLKIAVIYNSQSGSIRL